MDVLDVVFDPAYVGHFPGVPPIQSLDEQKTVINSFLEAFPDSRTSWPKGTRWRRAGRLVVPILGVAGLPSKGSGYPPTGRHVTFSATNIYRIANGKIVEEWNTLEQFDVLSQLGAAPITEQGEE